MNGTQTKPAFCSQSGTAPAGSFDHDRLAAEPAEHAGRDDQRHDELHDADAEIAEAGIERQRIALLGLGEEEARCSPSRRRNCRRRSRTAAPAPGRSSRA